MEITASAYQNLRDFMQANWKYIELKNASGDKIIRLTTSDPRVTWVHEVGATELQLQVIIKGSDVDITVPTTFASSSIYNVATGGAPFSTETFNQFTIESENDELSVVHSIQVPQA